jgi:2-dehydro-3-deoxyphosphogluconate aldolase/(4S)-4-hydroxy-2-oxoglutarate aldolase
MDKKSELLKLIPEQGILPLYFNDSIEVSIDVLRALYAAGLKAVEYAQRGEKAFRNFEKMRQVCDTELKGMYLGIGTIKNESIAKKYIDAGADFIICPGIFESVSRICNEMNILCIPGCMTPTDIISAEASGATIVKLFPANSLGPSYLEAIKAIFPGLLFMPTGGIELNKENLTGWLKTGICAVGGSKLITKSVMDNQQYDELTINTKEALMLFQTIRSSLFPVESIKQIPVN